MNHNLLRLAENFDVFPKNITVEIKEQERHAAPAQFI